jgi:hypothetical protein
MAEPNRKHPSNFDRYLRVGGSARRNPPLPQQAWWMMRCTFR